jgi:hypothetical protein
MIEDCPETDIEFDARRFTSAHELRHAECFYWNMARRRYYGLSAPCCRALRVSADRAACPGPHTRGKSASSSRTTDWPRMRCAEREATGMGFTGLL